MKTLRLKKKEARRVLRGHPWIFSNEIVEMPKDLSPGDLVEIHDFSGVFIGRGYANPHTLIAVRLLTREREEITTAFFRKKIESARDLRIRLGFGDSFRALFSEGDGLPGLIVDKYADILVLQCLTAGIERQRDTIIDVLKEVYSPTAIVLRNDSPSRQREGLVLEKKVVHGAINGPVQIEESGLRYPVDVLQGQKTGFFFDQRENRLALRDYVKDGRVLDCFCYVGAWSLTAARSGARAVTALTGYGWLWAEAASGTDIIDSLGEEHLLSGKLIVYTSADSVFQIAAHDRVLSLDELYKVCETTRMLADEYNIGRVIARPFTGAPGAFKRLPARRDFATPPPSETLLEIVKRYGQETVGIGKIGDIFVHQGLTEEAPTVSDDEGIDRTIEFLGKVEKGLIFTNLVDLDTLYGHRNDPEGYARALERMDSRLPELMTALGPEDILFRTGDHGCDPTTPSTDHSREYVPLLVFGKAVLPGVDLGTRATFADLGATVAEALGAGMTVNGSSFLSDIIRKQ